MSKFLTLAWSHFWLFRETVDALKGKMETHFSKRPVSPVLVVTTSPYWSYSYLHHLETVWPFTSHINMASSSIFLLAGGFLCKSENWLEIPADQRLVRYVNYQLRFQQLFHVQIQPNSLSFPFCLNFSKMSSQHLGSKWNGGAQEVAAGCRNM